MTDRSMGADRDRLSSAQSEVRSWRARAGEAARRMEDMAKRTQDTAIQQQALEGKPEAIARDIKALDESSHALLEAAEAQQRSEEHTSELQSLMRISYAVFCLKTKRTNEHTH